MDTINRGVLLVIAKAPFYNWANRLDTAVEIDPTTVTEHSSYLIGDEFVPGDIRALLEDYYEAIFEQQLFDMHQEEKDWPTDRSLDVFFQWFDVKLSSVVFDLVADVEPLMHDDEMDDLDFFDEEDDDFGDGVRDVPPQLGELIQGIFGPKGEG